MSRPSRRGVLAGGLAVGFSLSPAARLAAQAPAAALPGSLAKTPLLDAWIRIGADGRVTVFTGKAELGQGITTALFQLAAEELAISPAAITLVTADTARTPDEGYTAGSHSMQDSGSAIREAAAELRGLLVLAAAAKFGVPAAGLTTRNGTVVAPNGESLSYGALAAGLSLHVPATGGAVLKTPASYAIVGRSTPRVDIPAKVSGGEAFVQDLRLDGMVHARILRPPGYGARLAGLDTAAVERLPGVIKIVRDGSFVAVAAAGEWQAVAAQRALAAAARWQDGPALPPMAEFPGLIRRLPAQDQAILDRHAVAPDAARTLAATYTRPYLMHGSIGPSCAVAQFQDGGLTVWTHSQGVFPLRAALAEMLGLAPDKVRCIQTEGSGCYGHNGADDVAADAALVARALPGRPVRVQWMREDEHRWEPFGPAMVAEVKAGLDVDGRIVDWIYDVWSNTHTQRPDGHAGLLLAAQYLKSPFPTPPPHPIPMPEGGGDRNAVPLYDFPNAHVTSHFVPQMPLRVSALRGLGAWLNVFAIESFIDEAAAAAKTDPVAFRLKHLDDPRARAVVGAAAEYFGWSVWERAPGRGRGFGFARYKNLAAYCAVAVEADIERETGRVRLHRAVAATDSGQAVNPDGIKNQIEGAILQSASWTLFEEVRFDAAGILSRDWSQYPILRFEAAPREIAVHVIDRPGQPFLGTGEAGQGPTAAAIANAVADATGARLRDLPLSPERLKAALGV